MKLIIDSLETAKIIKQAQKHFPNNEVRRLPVGDYIAEDDNGNIIDCCVERKEVGDFASSVKAKKGSEKGRIFIQAQDMAKSYSQNYIIIVGDLKNLHYRGIKFSTKQYYAAKASLNQVVHVDECRNNEQFFTYMKYLFEKANDGKDRLNRRVVRTERTTGDEVLDAITSVKGIGENKAELIRDEFTLYDLCTCSVEDLMTVKGVGKVQAGNIKRVFERKSKFHWKRYNEEKVRCCV